MTYLVDTSVIIDYLRGYEPARDLLETARAHSPLHASEISRLEVLAGVRQHDKNATRALLSTFIWHPVDTLIAERAGLLGQAWLKSHGAIDAADLAIAATTIVANCELLTRNIKHFPMFEALKSPY